MSLQHESLRMDEYFIDVTSAVIKEATSMTSELQTPDLEEGVEECPDDVFSISEENLSSALIMKERLWMEIRDMLHQHGHVHGETKELFREDPLVVAMLALASSIAARIRQTVLETLGYVEFIICRLNLI